jgi:hypothetical protein
LIALRRVRPHSPLVSRPLRPKLVTMTLLADGISGTSIAVWVIALLLAVGVAWTRYEKKKVRDKFLRELIAMDPARREKLLSRLRPDVQNDLRRELMERGVS